jgi:hypothetical protein
MQKTATFQLKVIFTIGVGKNQRREIWDGLRTFPWGEVGVLLEEFLPLQHDVSSFISIQFFQNNNLNMSLLFNWMEINGKS